MKVFHDGHQIYGARKIKRTCEDQGVILSRRRIGRIMAEEGLVSRYTVYRFKPRRQNVNRDDVNNIIDQNFEGRSKNEGIVSDLTYVRVGIVGTIFVFWLIYLTEKSLVIVLLQERLLNSSKKHSQKLKEI